MRSVILSFLAQSSSIRTITHASLFVDICITLANVFCCSIPIGWVNKYHVCAIFVDITCIKCLFSLALCHLLSEALLSIFFLVKAFDIHCTLLSSITNSKEWIVHRSPANCHQFTARSFLGKKCVCLMQLLCLAPKNWNEQMVHPLVVHYKLCKISLVHLSLTFWICTCGWLILLVNVIAAVLAFLVKCHSHRDI